MKPDSSIEREERTAPSAAQPGAFWGKDISSGAFRRALIFLFALGMIIRLGYYAEQSRSPAFAVPVLDEKYYVTVANMLLAGADLHELRGFRPLLYPAFLAVFFKLAGSAGAGVALLAQHLLGVATGLIVAALGARVFQNRIAGLLAGLFYLLSPVALAFEGELLIEPSYVFIISCGLLVHLQAAAGRGWRQGALWMFGGVLVVLAAQARANILAFLPVYPLCAFWKWRQGEKIAALRPLLGLAGALCMMIPCGIVNMSQSEHFHLLPGAGGVSLYCGNRRGADGMTVGNDVIKSLSKLSIENQSAGNSGEAARRIGSGERYQDLMEVWAGEEYAADMRRRGREPDADPMAISAYWTGRTLGEIKASPVSWLRLMAKKCWLSCWNAEVPNNKDFRFLQMEFFWLRVPPVRWVVFLMLAPAGIWAAWRHGNRDGLFILLVYAGCYSAANVAFFICDRYRYPVYPALAVFAGGGLLAGFQFVRRQLWRETSWLAASVVVVAAISLPAWLSGDLPNFAQDYYFRSSACYEKGLMADALADAERSIALNPRDAGVQHHRGNVLFAMNRLADARLAYERALELAPGDSGIWNNLGVTLKELGDTGGALKAFQKATDTGLPSENAFMGMAALQIRAGLLDGASLTLARLHALEPAPGAGELALRSALARKQGDAKTADALEQKARSLDADFAKWMIGQATAK